MAIIAGLVMGKISHQRLMELKNSGVVDSEGYKKLLDKFFRLNKERKDAMFLSLTSSEKLKVIFNSRVYKDLDRFSEVTDLRVLEINKDSLFLDSEQIEDLRMVRKALQHVRNAKDVLDGFKVFDEVLVDNRTARAVDWLLYNKIKLKDLLQQKG